MKKFVLAMIVLGLFICSYSAKLIVRTNPPLSGFPVVIFSESGGQNYYNTTNSFGQAVFNLPIGDYIVDINPSYGMYNFSQWSTSGGVEILCSNKQIPLFIHVSGDGVLLANFTSPETGVAIVDLGVSSNLYEVFPVHFELKYNGHRIMSDDIVGTYELQIQRYKIYNLTVPRTLSFGSLECSISSIYVKGIDIIKNSSNGPNETIEFTPNNYYNTLKLIYTCGAQTKPKENKLLINAYPINVNFELNGTSHRTPYYETISPGQVYFIKYPLSSQGYGLSDINIQGDYRILVKNLTNGSIIIKVLGSTEVDAIYNQGVVKYLLSVNSAPYNVQVCVKNLINGSTECNETPFTLALPMSWYQLYTENKSFEGYIMNGVLYYDNPLKFALYQNTNIVVKLAPRKPKTEAYSVSVDSNEKVYVTVANGTMSLGKETPFSLGLAKGIYRLGYPKYLTNGKTFEKVYCNGLVVCLNNTSIEVQGPGSVYIDYENKTKTTPKGRCLLIVETPYYNDKTLVYYDNGTLARLIIGQGQTSLVCGQYILKQEKTNYTGRFSIFDFQGWYYDGKYYNGTNSLKIDLSKVTIVKKIFNVYYLVRFGAFFYNMTPVKGLEISFAGRSLTTNSSGMVERWIKSGSEITIQAPEYIDHGLFKANIPAIETKVTRPYYFMVVYYPNKTKAKPRPRLPRLYELRILVKDSYLSPIKGIEVFVYDDQGHLVLKGTSNSQGLIEARLAKGKYYILALFKQGNWVIGKIVGVDHCQGANYCEFSLDSNKSLTIVYVNTSKKIGYLQLNIYDSLTKKPLNCSVQVCRLNVFAYNCFVGRTINGIYSVLLSNGKYKVSIVCKGYLVKNMIVNLLNYYNKTIYLTPLKPRVVNNTVVQKKVNKTMFKLTIYTYPMATLHVVGPGLTKTLVANESGLVILELPAGQYEIFVGNIHRTINLSSNMGLVLKNLSQLLPKSQGSKLARLELCVLVNNQPYKGFVYVKNVNQNQTLRYYIDNGCRDLVLEKGQYVLSVLGHNKTIDLESNTTIRWIITTNKPNVGFLIGYVALILAILFGFIILLLRRYLGSRFFR